MANFVASAENLFYGKAGEARMTIKEFAKKYGLDYQFVWMALHETGVLIHGTKNMRYNEKEILQACGVYSFQKIDVHKEKSSIC